MHGGVKLTVVSLAEQQTALLGIETWQYPEIFLFLKCQSLLLLSGYRGALPRVKRPGRDTDQSSPSSAEAKNEGGCTSIAPYSFVTCTETTLTLQFSSRLCRIFFTEIYSYMCVCVCMYVCTYVRMYVCIYVRTYVCMYVCMHVCMHVCMYIGVKESMAESYGDCHVAET